tara:strand:+ start:697 stop:1080 length:384 start_codon:yes stop_codon:yes gene_type:complete
MWIVFDCFEFPIILGIYSDLQTAEINHPNQYFKRIEEGPVDGWDWSDYQTSKAAKREREISSFVYRTIRSMEIDWRFTGKVHIVREWIYIGEGMTPVDWNRVIGEMATVRPAFSREEIRLAVNKYIK